MPLITKICVSNNVTEIGTNAFSECDAIEQVEIPFIGNNENSTEKFDYIFGTCVNNIKRVSITNDATIPASAFCQLSALEEITLCDKTTIIGEKAFYKCVNLKNIVIPKAVTEINKNAFYGCAITTITIPKSVVTIKAWAFDDCNSLTSITFDENSNLKTIESGAFSGCHFTSFKVPNGVDTIGGQAFYCCHYLEYIIIPTTVSSMANNTISGSGFIDIFYEGDESKFNQIRIKHIADSSYEWLNSKKYFYTDSEPQLNEEGTAYNGNYWRYVDGVPAIWVYSNEE